MQSSSSYNFFGGASNVTVHGGHFGTHSAYSGFERLHEASAPNALHNSGHIPDPQRCHPGTGEAVMGDIMSWVEGTHEDTREKGMSWVTGAAGAGKTAIARSICERCEEEGKLLAAFFFHSGDSTRNHSRSLVATLCTQICTVIPSMRLSVSNVISNDPHIFRKSLKIQFQSLLITPLSEITSTSARSASLIVIDGLDECESKASQKETLEALFHVSTTSPVPLRILVFSRPEINITNYFNIPGVSAHVFKIFLGYGYSPDTDIKLYLSDHFKEIQERPIFKCFKLPEPWPTDDQIHSLVYKSSGQFIFASTVIGYVGSESHHPDHRLKDVLGLPNSSKGSPFSALDALYARILNTVENPNIATAVLTFPAMYGNITISAIETILDLQCGEVELLISGLGAISQIDVSWKRIVLLHKSFKDFLFDPYRSNDLFVDLEGVRISHVIHGIQIISDVNMRQNFKPWDARNLDVLNRREFKNWLLTDGGLIMTVLTAFMEIPFEAMCKEFASTHANDGSLDYFFKSYFDILKDLSKRKIIEDIFYSRVHTFCQHILSRVFETSGHRSKVELENLLFAITNFQQHPVLQKVHKKDCMAVHERFYEVSRAHSRAFGRAINELVNQSRLIAISATKCLRYLSGTAQTRREAAEHLNLIHLKRHKKMTRSWSSHGHSSLLANDEQRVIFYSSRHNIIKIIKYKDLKRRALQAAFLYHFLWMNICPTSRMPVKQKTREKNRVWTVHYPSYDWSAYNGLIRQEDQWFTYMNYLDYLPQLLRNAGPYEPLIDLCKTKAFSSMSMLFSKDSRRARRAIDEYLKRVESGAGGK